MARVTFAAALGRVHIDVDPRRTSQLLPCDYTLAIQGASQSPSPKPADRQGLISTRRPRQANTVKRLSDSL